MRLTRPVNDSLEETVTPNDIETPTFSSQLTLRSKVPVNITPPRFRSFRLLTYTPARVCTEFTFIVKLKSALC